MLVCDEYHREDGIVRNAPYARTAVRGSPAVLIRIETALRNGNTNIKKARKILEYTSRRSAYHVQSKYSQSSIISNYAELQLLDNLHGSHHNTFFNIFSFRHIRSMQDVQ